MVKYTWMNLKMSFSVYRAASLWYALDILMAFFIWTHGDKKPPKFMKDLNNHQPNIKFLYTFSKNCVPFLGLCVQLSGGELNKNLYIKPRDRHQYLHFTSFHPNHTKRSNVYSQALRVSRIHSRECEILSPP